MFTNTEVVLQAFCIPPLAPAPVANCLFSITSYWLDKPCPLSTLLWVSPAVLRAKKHTRG